MLLNTEVPLFHKRISLASFGHWLTFTLRQPRPGAVRGTLVRTC